jgi:hypothetical protein
VSAGFELLAQHGDPGCAVSHQASPAATRADAPISRIMKHAVACEISEAALGYTTYANLWGCSWVRRTSASGGMRTFGALRIQPRGTFPDE